MRHALLFAMLGLSAIGSAQRMDPQRDFVIAGKNAYLLFPPDFVCGPSIRLVAWSPDGERLAAIRTDSLVTPAMAVDMLNNPRSGAETSAVDPEHQIVVWSSVTRKTSVWMTLRASQGQIESVNWLAGSSSLAVEASLVDPSGSAEPQVSLLLLNPSGRTRTVIRYGVGQIQVNPSPFKPIVALIDNPPMGEANPPNPKSGMLRLFGADGVLSGPIQLDGAFSILFWSKDGNLYVLAFERQPKPQHMKRVWFVVNRSAMRIEPVSAPTDAADMQREDSANPGELQVQDWNAQLSKAKIGIKAPTVVIAPKGGKDDDFSIVTTDGKDARLSPATNGVSYDAQGSLMVRSMVKVSLEVYLKAKQAAERAVLLSNAKQVGLALIMYANDYDDVLMSNTSNWQSLIEPYITDTSLCSGFQYVFGGGNMDSIESPADTILGYFDGPGGRAIVYTDGHAKWVNN